MRFARCKGITKNVSSRVCLCPRLVSRHLFSSEVAILGQVPDRICFFVSMRQPDEQLTLRHTCMHSRSLSLSLSRSCFTCIPTVAFWCTKIQAQVRKGKGEGENSSSRSAVSRWRINNSRPTSVRYTVRNCQISWLSLSWRGLSSFFLSLLRLFLFCFCYRDPRAVIIIIVFTCCRRGGWKQPRKRKGEGVIQRFVGAFSHSTPFYSLLRELYPPHNEYTRGIIIVPCWKIRGDEARRRDVIVHTVNYNEIEFLINTHWYQFE